MFQRNGLKPKAVLIQPVDPAGVCFTNELQSQIQSFVEVKVFPALPETAAVADGDWLKESSILLSTWGMPRIDELLLERMPRLEMVIHAAGNMGDRISPQAWKRGIRVSSSIALNSEPVAQFALAQTLFALKLGWHHVRQTRDERRWERISGIPGTHQTRVGIVSLGIVGRRLVELLTPFGVEVVAYDIEPDYEWAHKHHVRYTGLDELFATSQVTSIHTPSSISTRQMITGDHIASMPLNAVVINTARGAIIDQPGMIRALRKRLDLMALLDVTDPEPPPTDSPLWLMPNVVLTPHIAGAFGHERKRLGEFAIAELRRYLAGEPLSGEIYNPFEPDGLPVVGKYVTCDSLNP